MTNNRAKISEDLNEVHKEMMDWHSVIISAEDSKLQSLCFDKYVELAIRSRQLVKKRRLMTKGEE